MLETSTPLISIVTAVNPVSEVVIVAVSSPPTAKLPDVGLKVISVTEGV